MSVLLHDEWVRFRAAAEPLFMADPVRHTIAVTLLAAVDADSALDPGTLLLTVIRDDRVVGACLRTPPRAMWVSGLPVEAHQEVVDFLAGRGVEIGGVVGPLDVAEPFCSRWQDTTGDRVDVTMRERVYRLAGLAPPEVPGGFRFATTEDIPFLGAWWDAFVVEAIGRVPGELPGVEHVRRSLATNRRIGIWSDAGGEPVAMAGVSPPVRGMSRVGPVYTPPGARGRGHGSAVVAAACRWALEQGARDVVLFADLANPVSNSIYESLGFRPVSDAVEYRFAARPTLEP